MFQHFSPANFSVPDLAGLMERFFLYSHWPYPFPLDFNFQHLKNRYLSYICCFQGFRAQIFNQLVQTPTGYFPQLILVGTGLGICFLGRLLARISNITRLTWVYGNYRGTGGVMSEVLTHCRQLIGAFSTRPPGPHTLLIY